jgi:hypothetical protein
MSVQISPTEDTSPPAPRVVVVMGVSGCGKSTVGALLALIARRIATRHEHFMPPGLLHSQFEALEEPGPDENPIIVSIEPQPREIVTQISAALNIERAQPPKQISLGPSVRSALTNP